MCVQGLYEWNIRVYKERLVASFPNIPEGERLRTQAGSLGAFTFGW